MKTVTIKTQGNSTSATAILRRFAPLLTATFLTMVATSVLADDDRGRGDDKSRGYSQTNLVSDQAGVAQLQDTNLTNSWGVSFSSNSPFWVSDNGSGKATLYAVTNDSSGAPHVTNLSLVVNIPGAGNPTGQVFNNDTNNFNGDLFIFVSEDGTISGWRSALGSNAEVLTTVSNAVYKGVTLINGSNGPALLAANFSQGTVDAFDGSMTPLGQLVDSNAPADYAPFNIREIHGVVFVTFAKQDADKHDDVPGPGHGLVDVLNLHTMKFHRLVTGSDAGGHLKAIDSPWGIEIAPKSFGLHSDQLLIGNFGSGTIMAFDEHGRFEGFLNSKPGKPIVIDGLWALTFGNGGRAGVPEILYFSAGPDGESHGLFGSLQPGLRKDHNHDDK